MRAQGGPRFFVWRLGGVGGLAATACEHGNKVCVCIVQVPYVNIAAIFFYCFCIGIGFGFGIGIGIGVRMRTHQHREGTKRKRDVRKQKRQSKHLGSRLPVGMAAGHPPVAVGLLRRVHGAVAGSNDPRSDVALLVGQG